MGTDKFYSMAHENQPLHCNVSSLADLASMCYNAGRGYVEVASNMQTDVTSRVKAAAKLADKRRAGVHTPQELAQYQKTVQQIFTNSLGGLPQTDAPLNARIVDSKTYPGFVLEKVIFESRPQVYVTCNIYKPLKPINTPGPAIFMPEGHYTEGKAAIPYQNVAQTLTHAGFLVMMMDPFGQGERFEHYESSVNYQPIPGASAEHNLMDSKLKCIGLSLARYFVHDGIRALEYLASRPDVDASRIGVTGNSGGGTQTYMLTAAAPEKIAAIAPCSFNTDMTDIIEKGCDLDNEQLWPNVLGAGVDYADILSVLAPKPVLLLCNKYDFFGWEGAERTFEKVKAFWSQIGAEVLPEIAFSNTEHLYTASLAKVAGTFFAKHLGLPEPDYTDYQFHPIPRKELECTNSGMVARDFPDTRTIQMELEAAYSQIQAERKKQDPKTDRENGIAWLRQTVLDGRRTIAPHTRVLGDGGCLNYIYRQLAWRAQENYWGCGVLLRDARFGNQPLPLVIALWPEGMQSLKQHSVWIHRQCAAGNEVLVADLAASGALSANPIAGRSLDTGWSTKYVFNGALICLGDSIAAMRAYQATRIPDAVLELPRSAPTKISYYGEGEFARYAKIAALLGGMAVETDDNYQSWGEIVTDKYADLTHYMDWLLPGAAAHADMDDLDRWLQEN